MDASRQEARGVHVHSSWCRGPDTVKRPLEAPIFWFPSGYVYLRTGVATDLGFRTYIYVRNNERVKSQNVIPCQSPSALALSSFFFPSPWDTRPIIFEWKPDSSRHNEGDCVFTSNIIFVLLCHRFSLMVWNITRGYITAIEITLHSLAPGINPLTNLW